MGVVGKYQNLPPAPFPIDDPGQVLGHYRVAEAEETGVAVGGFVRHLGVVVEEPPGGPGELEGLPVPFRRAFGDQAGAAGGKLGEQVPDDNPQIPGPGRFCNRATGWPIQRIYPRARNCSTKPGG